MVVDEKKLKETLKKTISRDDVKLVIGYRKGTYGFRVSPAFAFTPDDVEDFVFSPLCVNNLAVYLMLENQGDAGKIGVVVKGCDSRAVVQIIQEKGLKREDVVLIGVPCTGVVDPKKINVRFPRQMENVDVAEDGKDFLVTLQGVSHRVSKDELMLEKCKHCENTTPVLYDVLVGEGVAGIGKEDYAEVKSLEEKTLDERWRFWREHFSRCIRCYACRNICPMCYCEECIVERLSPQWIRRSVNLSENTVWNIIRAYHLAGRCIGCGECERACPMDIPLTVLNKKIEKDVKEMFDYVPGMDAEEKPLLAMFKPDDPAEVL
jgi:coenzyme F420-reducing hydrogenase beta subunit